MGIDLPIIWAIIIAFGLMMYVVMDGFDLGIGILFPFVRDRGDRDTMVNTVAPVWDGNETWLAFGGAALMAAFPLAYSVLLSALYIPLILMLAGLIWRGVAFEFRYNASDSHKPFWYKAYPGETYYVANPANVKQQLRDMLDFFNLYLKGIPFQRPDDGSRPLTHQSGTPAASGASRRRGGHWSETGAARGTPPPDVAQLSLTVETVRSTVEPSPTASPPPSPFA